MVKGMFLTKECRTWKHGLPGGGGKILVKGMFLIEGMLYSKARAANAGGGGGF